MPIKLAKEKCGDKMSPTASLRVESRQCRRFLKKVTPYRRWPFFLRFGRCSRATDSPIIAVARATSAVARFATSVKKIGHRASPPFLRKALPGTQTAVGVSAILTQKGPLSRPFPKRLHARISRYSAFFNVSASGTFLIWRTCRSATTR